MKKLLFLSIITLLPMSFMNLSLADSFISEELSQEAPIKNKEHSEEGKEDKTYYPVHRVHHEQKTDCIDQGQTDANTGDCKNKKEDHQEQNCTDGICTYEIPNF